MFDRDKVKRLKEKYTTGTRIELIKMVDRHSPEKGTLGTVEYVDDIGNIHMRWDNGSGLSLIEEEDEFRIVR